MILGKKKGNELPAVSTASLPDIIFMLLFFFMVVTVLRDSEQKLKIILPEASELTKLEQKSLVNYIQIGTLLTSDGNDSPRIQLNDKFATVNDIPEFIAAFVTKTPESLRPRIKTSLKVDRNVTMGIISDVKLSLRKSGQLAINYSARPN